MKEHLIKFAMNELGYKEGKNNKNKYGAYFKMDNLPWCALFVSYCARKVGIPTSLIPTYSACSTGYTWFKNKGAIYTTARAGDIVFYKSSKVWEISGHTGIVVEITDDYIKTVEGNAGSGTDGVYLITRKKNDNKILGYGRPAYNEESYTGEFPKIHSRGYFKRVDKSDEVKKLQKFLNWSLDINLVVDGYYGNKTYNAVKQFEKKCNVRITGLFGSIDLAAAKSFKK